MIHYSSINDAWGNKETFKNNTSSPSPSPSPSPSEIVYNKSPIYMEHKSCNTIEHLNKCSECKKKISELFTNTNNNTIVDLFGKKINMNDESTKKNV